jgi:hypothetical protein
MPEETNAEQSKPVMYAVIELFGHARVAGAVSEQNFGGANLIRVDVPEVKFTEVDYESPRGPDGYAKVTRAIPAHTRSLGAGSVYAVNWCDEETARLAAHSIRDEPLKPYSVREALEAIGGAQLRLRAPSGTDDEEDRDEIPY